MQGAEKKTCEACNGYGYDDVWGFALACPRCDGKGTVKQSLTVEHVSNGYMLDFEDIEQWALDGCPEGVSGMAQNVCKLIEVARQLQADDLRKRMSDAVTLLYTHGILTEKMRAHCRSQI